MAKDFKVLLIRFKQRGGITGDRYRVEEIKGHRPTIRLDMGGGERALIIKVDDYLTEQEANVLGAKAELTIRPSKVG